ncbi:MAG: DUF3795 domain-containing protein [Armatimonadota bacterium]
MDKKLYGYCGIDCTACDVFQATAADDDNLRRKCAENPVWKDAAIQYWGLEGLDPDNIDCKGCHAESGTIFISCARCPIRSCARNHGYLSCAECPDWQTCERLAGLLADDPQARHNLEELSGQK